MKEGEFLPLEEIEGADLSMCGAGLFQSDHADLFRNVLVTSSEDARHLVYLGDPKGAMVVPAPAGEGTSRLGILWPKPAFEVDPTTIYNPDRMREGLGDLILAPQPMIYAREPDGWFEDGKLIPLWGDSRGPAKPIAFRSWRLVSVVGDRRRIIFERAPLAGARPA